MKFVPYHSDEEIQQTNRFRTYLNYVCSIGQFLDKTPPLSLAKAVADSASFSKINGGKCGNLDNLAMLLRNSWLTEVQLNLSENQPEFFSYSNHWAPVQVYYMLYIGTRAYFEAAGRNVGGEHTISLKTLSHEIENRSDIFPQPWKTLCTGVSDSISYINLPDGVLISPISNLAPFRSISFWDSYALCLKTTRERQLTKSFDDWKQRNHKKRINSITKSQIQDNLKPTSIFNFLYRLRLKSNYEDVDSLLQSNQSRAEAANFSKSLRKISWQSMLLLELLIARYIGKKNYGKLVMKFIIYDKLALSMNLVHDRNEIIQSVF